MLKDRYEVAGSLLQKLWNFRRLILSPSPQILSYICTYFPVVVVSFETNVWVIEFYYHTQKRRNGREGIGILMWITHSFLSNQKKCAISISIYIRWSCVHEKRDVIVKMLFAAKHKTIKDWKEKSFPRGDFRLAIISSHTIHQFRNHLFPPLLYSYFQNNERMNIVIIWKQ